MIELPEAKVISDQMERTLVGKLIVSSIRGKNPHKFMFSGDFDNKTFSEIVDDTMIINCWSSGNLILVKLSSSYIITLGCGGERITYHEKIDTIPNKHQLLLIFDDNSALSVAISGWGGIRLIEEKKLYKHPHLQTGIWDPLDDDFTFDIFNGLISSLPETKKTSAKAFFITDPALKGIGNGVIQDIFLKSLIHPAKDMKELSKTKKFSLFKITRSVLRNMIKLGGRDSEYDLFGNKGGYHRMLHSKIVGKPCPQCGQPIEKIQYLGGSVYFCSGCQVL